MRKHIKLAETWKDPSKLDTQSAASPSGPASLPPNPTRFNGSKEDVSPPPDSEKSLPDVYYSHEEGCYYRREISGRYIRSGSPSIRRFFKSLGLSSRIQEGEFISELDAAIEAIETQKAVDYAAVLAGNKQGWKRIHGRSVLVTEGPNLVIPSPGDWPHLRRFFDSLLGPEQSLPLFAHLKLTDQCLRAGTPRPGQVVILAGPVNCGKSLFASLLTEMWGGGMGKPYASLCGKTDFNSELFTAVMQLVDDEAPSADPRVRKAFGSGLKTLAMNRDQRCHGKGRSGLVLTPLWRVVVLVNDDVPSLQVLPQLDAGLLDKLLIFKASPAVLPTTGSELEDKTKLWNMLVEELPSFIHFLQNWTIPAHVGGDSRFGVKAYRNAEIVELMDGVADEIRLLELIDNHVLDSPQAAPWEGTATQMEQTLRDASSAMAGKLFFATSSCGTLLGLLAKNHPNRVRKGKLIHGTQKWIVFPPTAAFPPADAPPDDSPPEDGAGDGADDDNPF